MKSFDVVIIGRGITGVSSALHLSKIGVTQVCLIGPERSLENCASAGSSYAGVTLHDNISRAVHGLGSDVAKDTLSVNKAGFCGLMRFVNEHQIPHKFGRIFRIADSSHETTEMNHAVSWLSKNGFPAYIETKSNTTIQSDGAAAASLDALTLLEKIEDESGADILKCSVQKANKTSDGIIISTSDGQSIRTEMIIAACHAGIKELVPEIASGLINHADQWLEFEILAGRLPFKPGDLIFAAHSHFWISYSHRGTIIAGGARFLRKWAGVEALSAPVMASVTATIKRKIEGLFKLTLSEPIQAAGLIDLRACDEIPIIGPMYGDSRVLLASGYMGSGLTFGYAAGQGLAEFVQSGKSQLISPIFHPKRLRSLAEGD